MQDVYGQVPSTRFSQAPDDALHAHEAVSSVEAQVEAATKRATLLLSQSHVQVVTADFCAYGTPWRKRTGFMAGNVDVQDMRRVFPPKLWLPPDDLEPPAEQEDGDSNGMMNDKVRFSGPTHQYKPERAAWRIGEPQANQRTTAPPPQPNYAHSSNPYTKRKGMCAAFFGSASRLPANDFTDKQG